LRDRLSYGILPRVSQAAEDNQPLNGMRIIRMLLPWREKLATAFGTSHGNADLTTINVLMVMLAAFYNPMASSLRCIDALTRQKHIREQTGLSRVARSTLSDALKRFDPDQLKPLIIGIALSITSPSTIAFDGLLIPYTSAVPHDRFIFTPDPARFSCDDILFLPAWPARPRIPATLPEKRPR